MITATVFSGSSALSVIPDLPESELKKGDMIIPHNTPLGDAIKNEILLIPAYHPEIDVIRFVIMPDHIHLIVNVRARLNKHLGNELTGFFSACSKHNQELNSLPQLQTLFQRFHDNIIFNYEQLNRAIKYIEDNPRRLIIKRNHPDLFRRYLHLEIAGHEYAAYGNIFLLKNIYLLPVRIHRRWSETEFSDYNDKCISEIYKGAIPISPAIHPAEKEIMKKAIEIGTGVIYIIDHGYENRFKPKGRNFELCSQGRLLLLAPWPENTGKKTTSGYDEFHSMNDMATAIASLTAEARLSVKGL